MLLTIAVAASKSWPVPGAELPGASIVEALLYDRVLLGVLRLAILVVALYAIASVPALIVGGRWAKGVGTGGIVADDAKTDVTVDVAEALRDMAALELENARLSRERDELLSLVDERTRPN